MAKARVELDEDLHQALSIQATKAKKSLKEYVGSLLLPVVDKVTWAFLGIDPNEKSVIGQPTATAKKPKVSKARLTDNPQALQAIRDLWRSGERSRAAIARQVGYPKSTVAENIKKMIDAGELEGEKADGEGPGRSPPR